MKPKFSYILGCLFWLLTACQQNELATDQPTLWESQQITVRLETRAGEAESTAKFPTRLIILDEQQKTDLDAGSTVVHPFFSAFLPDANAYKTVKYDTKKHYPDNNGCVYAQAVTPAAESDSDPKDSDLYIKNEDWSTIYLAYPKVNGEERYNNEMWERVAVSNLLQGSENTPLCDGKVEFLDESKKLKFKHATSWIHLVSYRDESMRTVGVKDVYLITNDEYRIMPYCLKWKSGEGYMASSEGSTETHIPIRVNEQNPYIALGKENPTLLTRYLCPHPLTNNAMGPFTLQATYFRQTESGEEIEDIGTFSRDNVYISIKRTDQSAATHLIAGEKYNLELVFKWDSFEISGQQVNWNDGAQIDIPIINPTITQ